MWRIDPWKVVFLAGFIVYVVIRGKFENRTAGNEKLLSRRDGIELFLLIIVGAGNVLLPAIYLFTPLLSFADRPLPRWAPWCSSISATRIATTCCARGGSFRVFARRARPLHPVDRSPRT